MTTPDPFADALRAWSSLAAGFPGAKTGVPSPLDGVVMQAHLASSGALLRSGQRATQSWWDYNREAAAAADLAGRVEAARAHLRRLAEIAADEAKQLEQHMRAFDEQVRNLVAATDPVPVRRAQAKD